jgi:nicotinate-nucleotide pyrophosphorylase (carboxylating)
VEIALEEDIRTGDVTTDSVIPADLQAEGHFVARQDLTLAGAELLSLLFDHVALKRTSGVRLQSGDEIATVRGPARLLLTRERVALNFLQRLSGVATLAAKYVAAVEGTGAKILDTRKTTPGLRALEKAAVVAGGGANHRFGLFDMVLLKDNHLAMNAGFDAFAKAVRKFRETRANVQIEVEADQLEQVRTFLKIDGIDVILLDNMKPAQIREAVALGKNKVKFEASGGVTLKNIRQIAATGVDYISIGALTHSPRAIDFSLELTPLAP